MERGGDEGAGALQTLRPVRNAAAGDFVSLHRLGYCSPGVCRGGWETFLW